MISVPVAITSTITPGILAAARALVQWRGMFTGIVRALGRVVALERNRTGARLIVALPKGLRVRRGDSVCVNGVCLTAARVGSSRLEFDLVEETLARSNLGGLAAGVPVNLEPSLTLKDPLGGHFVMGHVDAVGAIVSKKSVGAGAALRVNVPADVAAMMAVKGSVALDGVSLTLTEAAGGALGVALIPFTLENTTLGSKGPGDRVNVEVDVLARYVHAMGGVRRKDGGVSRELLRKAGFLR